MQSGKGARGKEKWINFQPKSLHCFNYYLLKYNSLVDTFVIIIKNCLLGFESFRSLPIEWVRQHSVASIVWS
jgi:hypothetical protein